MAFDEKTIQAVWEKANITAENDPDVWRQDICGAWIRRAHYGDRNSEYGWEIDHICLFHPKSIPVFQSKSIPI